MTQFDILVYVEEIDNSIKEYKLGDGKKPFSFEEAKQIAGSLYVGGYVHQESQVEVEPAISLYGPMQVKKVRLVPRKIIS